MLIVDDTNRKPYCRLNQQSYAHRIAYLEFPLSVKTNKQIRIHSIIIVILTHSQHNELCTHYIIIISIIDGVIGVMN